jgi:hypothetical protein
MARETARSGVLDPCPSVPIRGSRPRPPDLAGVSPRGRPARGRRHPIGLAAGWQEGDGRDQARSLSDPVGRPVDISTGPGQTGPTMAGTVVPGELPSPRRNRPRAVRSGVPSGVGGVELGPSVEWIFAAVARGGGPARGRIRYNTRTITERKRNPGPDDGVDRHESRDL